MARTPFDTFVKDLTVAALTPLGRAESDARIAPDPQFADVCFEPTAQVGAGATNLLERFALVGRTMFEFAYQSPSVIELGSWQRKQLTWWHLLQRAARRAKRPPPVLPPVLWGLSTGVPEDALRTYALTPLDPGTWPSGCYAGAPGGTLRLVAISELPRTRDTLLVRAMGRGATFRGAMDDLAALRFDEPERELTAPYLVRLSLQLQNDPDEEVRTMVMEVRKLYDDLMQKQLNLGIKRGRVEGIERGRAEGVEKGLRDAIRAVCEARGLTLTAAQRAKLAREARVEVLHAWLGRAATATRAAAIFASTR